MSHFPGLNHIFSALTEYKDITLREAEHPGNESPVFGQVSQWKPQWIFQPTGQNTFFIQIFLIGGPQRHLYVKDDKLFLAADGNKTAFSVEKAGDNKWRFHLPGKDQVLRLDRPDVQVKTAREDGSNNELWYIEEVHREA